MRRLALGFIFTLFFVDGVEAKACQPVPAELLPLLKQGSVIFVGETHGTVQMPESFYDIVCAASELGRTVEIGLEFTSDMTSAYQRFMTADQVSLGDARNAILNSDFWTLDLEHQDGRRSIAAFDLLENLRTLHYENKNISVFGFDQAVDDFTQRDRKMSEQILARTSPDKIVLVFTGSVHSMLEHWTPWNPKIGNAAAYVKEKYSETVSIKLLHTGGKAWVCQGECGVKERERTASNVDGANPFNKSDGSDKHSWNWNIGEIDASLPQLTLIELSD